MTYDEQYRSVLKRILSSGVSCIDRTQVGTKKVFDVNISVDLRTDRDEYLLPALTLRKVFPRVSWYELFWMLRGSTDVKELQDRRIKIWDGNSSREFLDQHGFYDVTAGYVPNSYGKQFRRYNGHVDQLQDVIDSIERNPHGRRHMISLWNPADINATPLPPCHVLYQFVVTDNHLNLKFYQRSSDFILAGNQNFMFASMFLAFMSYLTGYSVGTVSHSIGDCHIYSNLIEVAEELVSKPSFDMATIKYPFPSADTGNLDETLASCFSKDIWDDTIRSTMKYESNPKIDPSALIMAI